MNENLTATVGLEDILLYDHIEINVDMYTVVEVKNSRRLSSIETRHFPSVTRTPT